MSLTGTVTPLGTTSSQEGIYIDGAPNVYFEDTRGSYLKNPDSDGFYWGLSGTATYPVYKVGCYTDFKFGDNVTMNDVQCDASGVEGVIQSRTSLNASFTLESFLPLTTLTHLLRTGAVTSNTTDGAEKMGVGDVTRKQLYWKVYLTNVYDVDTGDYVSITLHKCQFVDAWEIAMPYGDKWTVPIKIRAFADTSKPAAQKFATIIRVDPSVVV